MTKISKNIKRLRNAQGISQEALAEKLFISRQAVSSWENDRTQPDIEMIGKLAEVFNVSIEELIYGEKRKLELENEEPKQNNKLLIIIFSILGSLFVAIGIIFFIFFGWESFGIGIKTFLGLLPMLAGQIVAIYTYMKKRHSIAFCESGALVWSVGVTATLLLVNGILGIDIELFILLALSAILILPAVYIFNSVSTLVGFFGLVLTATANGINDLLTIFFLVISMIAGVFFTKHSKGKVEDFRHNFSVWISTIAVFISIIELVIGLDSTLFSISIFGVFLALFTSLFAFSKERVFNKPFYLLGTLGLVGTLTFLTMIDDIVTFDFVFNTSYFKEENLLPYLIINLIIYPLIIGFGAFAGRNTISKNPLKIAIILTGLVATVFAITCGDTFAPIAIILTHILALCYIVIGTKSNKLYEVNVGLIAIIIIIFRIIFDIDINLLVLGFTFILSGATLLTVNLLLLKKAKKQKLLLSAKSDELVEDGDLNV
jgi:transcriptional regulator with XRE-family HTH domain